MTDSDGRFVDLYERFYRPVYAYCRRRTTAEAVDDVVAETFLVAWRKIDSVPRGSGSLLWLYGVAYRVLGNHWRTSSRSRKLSRKLNAIGHDTPLPPEELIVVGEQSRRVLKALDSLRPTDREILSLSAWEELPQADIAVVLDISIGAVRQRLYEAKRNLAKEFDRLGKKRDTPAARKGGVW